MRSEQMVFYTATILEWKKLLLSDVYKDVIVDSLAYLVHNQKITVYGFVIMPNHIHLLWKIHEPIVQKTSTSHQFLSYTAHQFQKKLKTYHPHLLEKFRVHDSDRTYQFWERNALATEIYSDKVAEQKLQYIHNNPLQPKWELAVFPEEYKYSSAQFYETGLDAFGFLTHYKD